MKVLPVAVFVLLAFAAFFMTFLVAPLAVLALFYVIYAARSRSERKQPAPVAEVRPRWGVEPELDETEAEAQAAAPVVRRPRITVESHSERAAAREAAAQAAAEAEAEAAAGLDGYDEADGETTATGGATHGAGQP
jgi:hypothetical protein